MSANQTPQEFADEIQEQINSLVAEVQTLPWYSNNRAEEIKLQIMRKRSILIALEQSDGVKPTPKLAPPRDINDAIRRAAGKGRT